MHILLEARYNPTNICAKRQRCNRSVYVLPKCYAKKVQEILSQTTPCVRILACLSKHDNAPSHTSKRVKQFLKTEKVTVLPRPPNSATLYNPVQYKSS